MSKLPPAKIARIPRCPICRGSSGIASFVTCSSCKVLQHGPCAERVGGCGTTGCISSTPPAHRLARYAAARLVGEWTALISAAVLLASALAWLPVLAAWAPPACWLPGSLAVLAMAPFFARVQVLKGEKSSTTWNPLHTRLEGWMERNDLWQPARLWFRRLSRLVVGANLALVVPALLCLAGAPMQSVFFGSMPGLFLAVSYMIPYAEMVGGFLFAAYLPTFLVTLGIGTPATMMLALVPGLLIAKSAMPVAEGPRPGSLAIPGEGRPIRIGKTSP